MSSSMLCMMQLYIQKQGPGVLVFVCHLLALLCHTNQFTVVSSLSTY
ncbi:MAG: hypothetical protein ACI92I_000036 [Acidimicrobiales bacterium]|jgi:hypothetical protein